MEEHSAGPTLVAHVAVCPDLGDLMTCTHHTSGHIQLVGGCQVLTLLGLSRPRLSIVRETTEDVRYRQLTPYIAVIRGYPLPQNRKFLTLPPTREAGSTGRM